MTGAPEWMADAACRVRHEGKTRDEYDAEKYATVEMFFASATAGRKPVRPRDRATANQQDQAKKRCESCTVRDQCLQYAARHGIDYGIWGGLTDYERRNLPLQQLKQRAG